jgi:hypothetical protein
MTYDNEGGYDDGSLEGSVRRSPTRAGGQEVLARRSEAKASSDTRC